jgi:18S rRNA (adenine1779-N6/adenine1780-N6)-dimethyltransferase
MIDDTFDIKEKINAVLESVDMGNTRAAKCDLDDFLK